MSQEPDGDKSRLPSLWMCLAFALVIYLLPFVAIAIDERVLKTYWFSHHLPNQAGEVFHALYPFYKLFYSP